MVSERWRSRRGRRMRGGLVLGRWGASSTGDSLGDRPGDGEPSSSISSTATLEADDAA